jgi:hypothetical protein
MTHSLESLGVHEMNAQEIRKVEGGDLAIGFSCVFSSFNLCTYSIPLKWSCKKTLVNSSR